MPPLLHNLLYPWGDSIVSLGTHGHCFNHLLRVSYTSNQQTNHYISNIQPTIRFRFADTLSCLDHVLEYCLGIHIQTMFKAGGILQCSSGGGWEGGHIAAWELPGATCTWTPELPSPGFTPCSYTALQRHTHTQCHTHTHSGSTWSRPGLWLPTGRQ